MYGLVKVAAYDPERAAELERNYEKADEEYYGLRDSIPQSIKDQQKSVQQREELKGMGGGAAIGLGLGAGAGALKGGLAGLGRKLMKRPVASIPREMAGSGMVGGLAGGFGGAMIGSMIGSGKGSSKGADILQQENPELHQRIQNALKSSIEAEDAMYDYEWQSHEEE